MLTPSYTFLIRLFTILAIGSPVVGFFMSKGGVGLFGAAIFGTMSLCLVTERANDRKYLMSKSGE